MGAPRGRLAPPYELDDDGKDREAGRMYSCDPANLSVHDPGDKQRIPKDCSRVMVTRRLPPIAGGVDQHVRVARVFYGLHDEGADEHGFLPGGGYKIRLDTPWGPVSLWPFEYSTIAAADLIALVDDGEMVFHPTNTDAAMLNEAVFYCQSRGIRNGEALVMALGSLKMNVGWFEPVPELALEAEAMEASVHAPWEEHTRRRARSRQLMARRA